MSNPIGVIAGTGLYHLPDLTDVRHEPWSTPFGEPTSPLKRGKLDGVEVVFVARHGDPHRLAPHRVNYRANLWALKQVGVHSLLSINAVGGISNIAPPGALVVCDQIIDYTHSRVSSFSDQYGEAVRHIDLSEPYTPGLRQIWLDAARRCHESAHDGGVMAVTQGPRLETRAEIARLHRDGCDVVGMTAMPEAALARELDIDYASLAVSANWAAGRGPEAEITMEDIERTLKIGMARAVAILRQALVTL